MQFFPTRPREETQVQAAGPLRRCHVCILLMPAHPLHGCTFGVVGTITPLVDLWVEERRLPDYMRAVPKAGG